jgi:phenylacetate-coenzyme A ligase PaaK-like adenylate-forming protein
MVPVHDYDSIKEYLNNSSDYNRGNDILSYALTSGTTGANKLIPITKKSIKDIRSAQKHVISVFLSRLPDYSLLKKRFYTLGGKSNIGVSKDGIGYGVASGINIKYMSPVLRKHYLPGLKVNDCDDVVYKNKTISKIIRNNQVGVFFGIPGSFVDFLINLKNILDEDSYKSFCSNVEVFLSSGSNYRAYKNEIVNLLGKEIVFVDIYASSEGYLGYESDEDDSYLELFSTLNFYEFIPLDEYYKGEYTNRCLITELKDGVDYAILVTTSAGVFSYIVGDIVRCVNAKECRVKLIGRTKLTINISSEKVTIGDVENVFLKASDRLKDTPKDFFVTAYLSQYRIVYHWFVVNNSTWQQYEKQFIGLKSS